MKKVPFLMLFLLVLGAAGTNAQVRIGGDGEPNKAAVLDLNADDATDDGTKGLALPRVSLTDATIALPGTPAVKGMLVYNTNTSTSNGLSGIGIYYWDDTRWVLLLTKGFWSASVSCTACAALPVNGATTMLWSTFAAPPWASVATCWYSEGDGMHYYQSVISTAGVWVRKLYTTGDAPFLRLYCWGP